MNLEQAFNTYYQELVYYGRKIIDNKPVVQDIVTDVFVALKNPQIDGLRFYLYRSVKNRCLNYLEHIKAKGTKDIESCVLSEEMAQIEFDFYKKMHEAVTQLKGAEKEVVDLLLQGKETAEVARILNKSIDNVRSIKRYAINRLRKTVLIVA